MPEQKPDALHIVMRAFSLGLAEMAPHTIAIMREKCRDLPGLMSPVRTDVDDYLEAACLLDMIRGLEGYALARLQRMDVRSALEIGFSNTPSAQNTKTVLNLSSHRQMIAHLTNQSFRYEKDSSPAAQKAFWHEACLALHIIRTEMTSNHLFQGGHLRAVEVLNRGLEMTYNQGRSMDEFVQSLPKNPPELAQAVNLLTWNFERAAHYHELTIKISVTQPDVHDPQTLRNLDHCLQQAIHSNALHVSVFSNMRIKIQNGDYVRDFLVAAFKRHDGPKRSGPVRDYELVEDAILRQVRGYLAPHNAQIKQSYNPEAMKLACNRMMQDLNGRDSVTTPALSHPA